MDADNFRLAKAKDIRSFLGVPLFDADQAVGILFIDSLLPSFYEDRHLKTTSILGALIVYLHLHWNDQISTRASRALGEALRQVRQSQGLTLDQLGSRLGLNRITLSRNESGAQPPSREGLYRWCSALGLVSATTAARVEVVDITSKILPILHDDPRKLALLSPEQFERFVAERLDRMGYDMTLSGPTTLKDGGIDLIAIPKMRTVGCFLLAGQVKHHRAGTRTGRAAVDRLLAWEASPFRLGLLVTNTEFTKDALWVAGMEQHRAFLRLRDFSDLKRWIQDDFSSDRDWREIPETIDVAPGVVIQVPRPGLAHPELVWPAAPRVITRE
jgi:transcriptional regulator with XRE-family HTH domain